MITLYELLFVICEGEIRKLSDMEQIDAGFTKDQILRQRTTIFLLEVLCENLLSPESVVSHVSFAEARNEE